MSLDSMQLFIASDETQDHVNIISSRSESKKEAEGCHRRAVQQQTESSIKHAQAAEGEMKSIQRREKAQQDQEKATTAVAKKRHKAVAKKIQE